MRIGGPVGSIHRRMSGQAPAVLVVEDDDAIRELICEALIEEGFDAEGADAGAVAVEAARNRRPAAVVLDISLPDMDGFETADALRRVSDPPPAFIVVTASANAQISAARVGAVGYLAKPFDIEELVKLVRAAIESAGTHPVVRRIVPEQA